MYATTCHTCGGSKEQAVLSQGEQDELLRAFRKMARHLFQSKQSRPLPDQLTHPAVKPMMQATHSVLSEGMARGITHSVPDAMRNKLANSVFVFSGMKTYQQLKQAGELLLDENGDIKPFERYWRDIQAIHANYNRSYLQAEYIFATQSAQMASKWSEFQADGDRYLLQYRTAGDNRVRDSHSILHEVTLPANDKFWDEAFPPNGWRCRCDAVQVRKGKYPESDSRQAIADARKATEGRQSIFRFNAGKREAIFPQNHPYYPESCRHCPFKKAGKLSQTEGKKDCHSCRYVKEMMENSKKADKERTPAQFLREIEEEPLPMNRYTQQPLGVALKAEGEVFDKVYINDKQMLHGTRPDKVKRGQTIPLPELCKRIQADLQNISEWRIGQESNEYVATVPYEDGRLLKYVIKVHKKIAGVDDKTTNKLTLITIGIVDERNFSQLEKIK